MSEQSRKIKAAIERSRKAISLKPSLGLGTGISKSRIVDGLRCEITEGKWTLHTDMPEGGGGEASAPTPGVFGRAALGSCLAIGYAMKAAERNITLNSIEVEVQATYDDGPLFGTRNDIPPGYLQVKYIVRVESDAPEKEIIDLIDAADKCSPYLDIFSRAQDCVREVEVLSSKII